MKNKYNKSHNEINLSRILKYSATLVALLLIGNQIISANVKETQKNTDITPLPPCPPKGSYLETCTATATYASDRWCDFETTCKKAHENKTVESKQTGFFRRGFFMENCDGYPEIRHANERQCSDPSAREKKKLEEKRERKIRHQNERKELTKRCRSFEHEFTWECMFASGQFDDAIKSMVENGMGL